jgi:hypothetical protein
MRYNSRSIHDAELAIRERFARQKFYFTGDLVTHPAKVVETESWWYIPVGWLGCAGFIVNKKDLYVNWLGSGISMDLCIWGHERGVFNDWVDFGFASETDRKLVARLVSKFRRGGLTSGRLPSGPTGYQESGIEAAVSRNFPVFRRHNVWLCIPELFWACESAGLRFTSELSRSPETMAAFSPLVPNPNRRGCLR